MYGNFPWSMVGLPTFMWDTHGIELFFINSTSHTSKCAGQNSHNNDVIMGVIASQITSLTNVYSTVYSDADQRKHQRSASLAFVRGIPRRPVNSPHKWPLTWKMFPFDDVIMNTYDIMRINFMIRMLELYMWHHATQIDPYQKCYHIYHL